MARKSWKVIAALLADRLAEYVSGGCPAHGQRWQEHWEECPHCQDMRTYQEYLNAGGHDFRQPPYHEATVTLAELIARNAEGQEQ